MMKVLLPVQFLLVPQTAVDYPLHGACSNEVFYCIILVQNKP